MGPGAIGTTVAAALYEAGRRPRICGRTARDQLELQTSHGRIVVPGPVQTDPAQAGGTVDLVFLAVKATQVEGAAPWLKALCGPDTVVCVLQNGVEQESIVRPYAGAARVIPAVVWFPSEPQPDGSIWLRDEAHVTLPDRPESRVVLDALRDSWCAVELAGDFTSVAWRKLLQNAVAGFMVLTGRRSGMFTRPDIAELALAYLRECLTVARAEGAVLGDDVPQQIAFGGIMHDRYLDAFGTDPARQTALSPTFQVAAPNAPAFLLPHVQRIDGIAQANELAAALTAAGTPAETARFPGPGLAGHGQRNRPADRDADRHAYRHCHGYGDRDRVADGHCHPHRGLERHASRHGLGHRHGDIGAVGHADAIGQPDRPAHADAHRQPYIDRAPHLDIAACANPDRHAHPGQHPDVHRAAGPPVAAADRALFLGRFLAPATARVWNKPGVCARDLSLIHISEPTRPY